MLLRLLLVVPMSLSKAQTTGDIINTIISAQVTSVINPVFRGIRQGGLVIFQILHVSPLVEDPTPKCHLGTEHRGGLFLPHHNKEKRDGGREKAITPKN